MRQVLFILTASLFLAASCNKEHLPEYYFKCKLNGQEYVPDNCANCRTAKLLGDTLLILGANRYVESIGIDVLEYPLKERTYVLRERRNTGAGTADYDNTIGNPSDIFRTDSLRTGQLTITTLDKKNKIVAGTFYFQAYNSLQNQTVNITEGKFRLQYKTN